MTLDYSQYTPDRDRGITDVLMALMGLISGCVVVPMAVWALLGHPETVLGVPAGQFVLVAPVVMMLGTVALSFLAAWAIQWLIVKAVVEDVEADLHE